MGWKQYRYLMMTLDPVHVGVGGYRLGRVDMAIAREPGTNLPKIPGTSLSGAARSYAAYQCESPRCAGQGQSDEANRHCGADACPICYTFGFTRGEGGGTESASRSGTASLSDARLLFFPVHSMVGPVWVTTPGRCQEAGFQVSGADDDQAVYLTWEIGRASGQGGEQRLTALNLGWLMLPVKGKVEIKRDGPAATWYDPTEVTGDQDANRQWEPEAWREIAGRTVVVGDWLFSHIVSSNLEVRTSVSLDPETGAARPGALFTYEAIPRAAVLWADLVVDDYRSSEYPQEATTKKSTRALPWKSPRDVVMAGLALAEHLGIGGMRPGPDSVDTSIG